LTPYRATAPFDWEGLLALIRDAFGAMDGRIDPPSSIHDLTLDQIARQSEHGEIWVVGRPVVACVFLTARPGALYLGKLAVSEPERRRGHARRLVDIAAERAKALGLPALELQSRIELTENHETFRAMGFVQTGATAHPGFDRPTSLTFRRELVRRDTEPSRTSP
jgi:GNAT superfamily N-acetyltransferase